jgi:hypothetical protein
MHHSETRFELKEITPTLLMLSKYTKEDRGPGIPLERSESIFMKPDEIEKLKLCLQKMK